MLNTGTLLMRMTAVDEDFREEVYHFYNFNAGIKLEDRFATLADRAMEQFNLISYFSPYHLRVVLSSNDRKLAAKRPALIIVQPGPSICQSTQRYDNCLQINTGSYVIQVVEAGKYGLDTEGTITPVRGASEGPSLF